MMNEIEEIILDLIDETCVELDKENLLTDLTEDEEEKLFLKPLGRSFAIERFARPVQATFKFAGLELTNEDALRVAYLCKRNKKGYENVAAFCAVPSGMDSEKCVKLLEVALNI